MCVCICWGRRGWGGGGERVIRDRKREREIGNPGSLYFSEFLICVYKLMFVFAGGGEVGAASWGRGESKKR